MVPVSRLDSLEALCHLPVLLEHLRYAQRASRGPLLQLRVHEQVLALVVDMGT